MSYTRARFSEAVVMIREVSSFVSSGFGSGYSPKAPGTVGSVVAFLVWIALERVGAFAYLSPPLLAFMVGVVGLLAVTVAMRGERSEDPQWIVIDEWAGLFVALCGADPTSFAHITIALIGFRVFDIWKPGPVRWAEGLPGAVGVMADDVVAGGLVFGGFLVYGFL
jgi:phosphatidylglycerophosphatase A